MEKQHLRYLAWAAAALLLIAILKMPYGYYQLLRVIVCVVGIIIAIHRYNERALLSAAFAALAAAVFNPIAPIHFDRETWAILNVVAAVGFMALAFVMRREARDGRVL